MMNIFFKQTSQTYSGESSDRCIQCGEFPLGSFIIIFRSASFARVNWMHAAHFFTVGMLSCLVQHMYKTAEVDMLIGDSNFELEI